MPVQWEGLDEFRKALRELPEQLRAEAAVVVEAAARASASEVKSAYEQVRTPSATGRTQEGQHLADRVVVSVDNAGTSYARAFVRSKSPHAHLFEFGTASRRWKSGKSTGSAPARPTMIPIVERNRRKMHGELVAIVKKAGFEVSGDA